MRISKAAGLLSLALATTSVAARVTGSDSTATPTTISSRQGGFVTTDGTLFNIDGVSKYYAGTNSYW